MTITWRTRYSWRCFVALVMVWCVSTADVIEFLRPVTGQGWQNAESRAAGSRCNSPEFDPVTDTHCLSFPDAPHQWSGECEFRTIGDTEVRDIRPEDHSPPILRWTLAWLTCVSCFLADSTTLRPSLTHPAETAISRHTHGHS